VCRTLQRNQLSGLARVGARVQQHCRAYSGGEEGIGEGKGGSAVVVVVLCAVGQLATSTTEGTKRKGVADRLGLAGGVEVKTTPALAPMCCQSSELLLEVLMVVCMRLIPRCRSQCSQWPLVEVAASLCGNSAPCLTGAGGGPTEIYVSGPPWYLLLLLGGL